MLNAILRFSLYQRVLVAAASVALLLAGGWCISQLPIDVFPDLNRPRVVVMTEAHGMAPEEVESLVTFPIETSISGATGVQEVRSASSVGLSVIYVEFEWGTDIYTDRQIVSERLATVSEQLPPGVSPQLAPISSIMGQIMMIGMYSEGGRTDAMELRTLADWVVRRRLLTIPGVSQVYVMGGDRKQFQVLVNPKDMLRKGVTLEDIKTAIRESNQNASGGYLDEHGPNELLVRAIGRITDVNQLRDVVVKTRDNRSVLLSQVARVVEAPQVKRGDSAVFDRTSSEIEGHSGALPAIVLTINKQPGADTRTVTNEIAQAMKELESRLPADVRLRSELYQQKAFIDRAIENVVEALRDGGILVVVILFLFLLNFRTTLITLTAIPMSIVITGLVFTLFGLSINTMTLGGLAVAIGELVDDAIVDVENCMRRLRDNRLRGSPRSSLSVVYHASVEIRSSVVFATIIVILVFLPLFALGGMEGRLFQPLGVAYVVSIAASLLVSLTLTPVMAYWLLRNAPVIERERESGIVRFFKSLAGGSIRFSLRHPIAVMSVASVGVLISAAFLWKAEQDFLPPFNEGAVQVNVVLPAGTSLATTTKIVNQVEERLRKIDDVQAFIRKTGRAELDEHAEGVNVSEFVATLDPNSPRARAEILDDIRSAMSDVPGIVTAVEQPLAHLISHMLSGVKAQIAIKIYGDDLDLLRRKAVQLQSSIADVRGVKDLQIEQQVIIPQLRIEVIGSELKTHGLRGKDITDFVETAMQGEVVSRILVDQRSFDLLVRLDERYREDLDAVKRLSIKLPNGGTTQLQTVANIYRAGGPNTINRQNARRRILLQCNTSGRGLVDVVRDIKQEADAVERSLPVGYYVEYGGQFESQQSASKRIAILFGVAILGMFLVLYIMFRSANLAIQVMMALPMAFIGAVAALQLTGQALTIASMVGFISLCGIASRNGILLINHYLHLVRHEGESWTQEMIIRAGQERMSPVLMTALTSGIGLVPLALAAGEPGKEILYPVATVIIGGLISSTILEFFVRPALFWTFGVEAAEDVVDLRDDEVRLEDSTPSAIATTATPIDLGKET